MREESNQALKKKILLVDDEKHVRSLTKGLLIDYGHDVHDAEDYTSAKKLVDQHRFDLVITDVDLRDGTGGGLDLVPHVRQHPVNRNVPIIVMSGRLGDDIRHLVAAHGKTEFVGKRESVSRMMDAVEKALKGSTK